MGHIIDLSLLSNISNYTIKRNERRRKGREEGRMEGERGKIWNYAISSVIKAIYIYINSNIVVISSNIYIIYNNI